MMQKSCRRASVLLREAKKMKKLTMPTGAPFYDELKICHEIQAADLSLKTIKGVSPTFSLSNM
jgi:hypothetical protein